MRAAGLFSWILDEKRRRYSLIFHEIMVYKHGNCAILYRRTYSVRADALTPVSGVSPDGDFACLLLGYGKLFNEVKKHVKGRKERYYQGVCPA